MNERFYQLALTLVPHIGDVHAKILVQHLGTASAVFGAPLQQLEKIEGIGTVRAGSIKGFRDFEAVDKELAFLEKFGIRALFLTDKDYPQRLLHCYDAPTLLFYKGEADLNPGRMVAIVGTRLHTEYGKAVTESLVKELAPGNVTVVSGLAYGIDALAHKAALKNNLPTIGVVAHGLDKIYPSEHASLAREMVKTNGGLLTEFLSGTLPDKHNFPLRNRVVAGMCDATVVIETGIKGGSMITARLADGYHHDVFAVPGRTTDGKSSGCNHLIQHNRAILLTDGQQLLACMGWEEKKKTRTVQQPALFPELTPEEKQIVQLLQEQTALPIDEINWRSGCNSSAVAAAILNLELQGVVAALPGKIYKLL